MPAAGLAKTKTRCDTESEPGEHQTRQLLRAPLDSSISSFIASHKRVTYWYDVPMSKSTGTLLGYVRVSTNQQDEQMQHDALDAAGVLKRNRYTDHGISGAKKSRPGLDAMLADARTEREQGNEVKIVTFKLDRIGRSAAHVISLVSELQDEGIELQSVKDGLDTTTTTGRAMLGMLAIFAEMERSFISERTTAGLASKKAQGIVGGRPKALDGKQAKQAQALRDAGQSPADIAKALHCSIATVYRITKAPAQK
ncbi:recombinase family protein [soil metagenome]